METLLLCPSAGTGHLDLSMDLIRVRSKEGFEEEGELLSGSMILPPAESWGEFACDAYPWSQCGVLSLRGDAQSLLHLMGVNLMPNACVNICL